MFVDDLLWHWGAHLLGKEDIWDNLIRLRSEESVNELLEITLSTE